MHEDHRLTSGQRTSLKATTSATDSGYNAGRPSPWD
jgi:hypothetical protein